MNMKNAAESLVNCLLEQETDAELELSSASVDGMDHTTWMLRAPGSDPTQYLAFDLAHTYKLARQRAQEKARLLGVRITKVIDHTAHSQIQ